MANYQVLFSGEISEGADAGAVRENLARELGIDERKVKQLFSGRTVVVKSQLSQEDALAVQVDFANFGALCRIKDLTPKIEPKLDFRIDRQERGGDHTLRDITAAHLECPRCGHLQLEASHCARCGIDIGAAIKAQRKEDLLIEKKIRELHKHEKPRPAGNVEPIRFETEAQGVPRPEDKKRGKMMSWLRKTS